MAEESTTPDLVERVRAIFEVLNQLDWDAAPPSLRPGCLLGRDGDPGHHLRWPPRDARPLAGLADLHEDLAFELQELVDVGNGVVLTVIVAHGHPVGSSGYVESHEAWVFEGADGMIVRVQTYRDIDEACAAAERLAEETG